MLSAQGLQVKESRVLHAKNHTGLNALNPPFLSYIAAYESLIQKKEGIQLGAQLRPAMEPLISMHTLNSQGLLSIPPFNAHSRFKCQSSLLGLASS